MQIIVAFLFYLAQDNKTLLLQLRMEGRKMARIKSEHRVKSDKFKELSHCSNQMKENNDCTVIAVSVACGISYEGAHALLERFGRKPGKGFKPALYHKAIQSLGFKLIPVKPHHFIIQYPKAHQILKNCTSHHPDRFPEAWKDGQTYICGSNGHVFTVKDGVNHDWSKGRQLRMRSIYRVEKTCEVNL